MKFPKFPFELNDSDLIDYLVKANKFCYFQKPTKDLIAKIDKRASFEGNFKTFKNLWPLILTDAVRKLKEKDNREWVDESSELFFHKDSLGIKDLQQILDAFAEYESMLYGASPDSYRDHIIHSFKVWLMGHGILLNGFGANLVTELEEYLKINSVEWECMWAITALCHDVGYPIESIEKVNKKARGTFTKLGLYPAGDLRFIFSQQSLPFHETIIKLMSSKPIIRIIGDGVNEKHHYFTHIQNKYFLKFFKSFDKLNHGIVSALLIAEAMVYFLESDLTQDKFEPLKEEDARQFLIRREILRAIAAHTCLDIYHIRFNTLSFLLYLVDELQCWGRPTFEQLRDRDEQDRFRVKINEFNHKIIDVQLVKATDDWTPIDSDNAKYQINKIHQILRLAVDTKELLKLNFIFRFIHKDVDKCKLIMKNGKLRKIPNNLFNK